MPRSSGSSGPEAFFERPRRHADGGISAGGQGRERLAARGIHERCAGRLGATFAQGREQCGLRPRACAGEAPQRLRQFGFIAAGSDGLGQRWKKPGGFARFADEFGKHLASAFVQRRQDRRVHPADGEFLPGEAREERESARVVRLTEAEGALDLHTRTLLAGGGGECGIEKRTTFVAVEPNVAELQRMHADGLRLVAGKRLYIVGREHAQSIECPQGRNERGRAGIRGGEQRAQGRRGGLFAAFRQQPLRGLPPPKEPTRNLAGE